MATVRRTFLIRRNIQCPLSLIPPLRDLTSSLFYQRHTEGPQHGALFFEVCLISSLPC